MARYKRNYSRNYRHSNHQAKKHIAEAESLSRELGGTDKDVKNWFFTRSEEELAPILEEYKERHGVKAYDYALVAIPRWKSGRTKMSGMVAERLFNLLPDHMPLETKYSLVDSLWKHVGPRRKRVVEVGSEAEIEEVITVVKEEVMSLSTQWEIPDSLNRRFKWLGNDDSTVYQQLLSHIIDNERNLAVTILEEQVPVIRDNFESNWKEVSHSINYVIEVGKQSVELRIKKDGSFVKASDWYPDRAPQKLETEPFNWGWLFVVAIIIFILVNT